MRGFFHITRRRLVTQNATTRFDVFPELTNHDELYQYSIKNRQEFWDRIALSSIHFDRPYESVCTSDFDTGHVEWFRGGMMNASFNSIDVHLNEGRGDKTAFYWEGDELGDERQITYNELHDLVCQFSNYFRRLGLKPGDTVAVYLPTCIEAAAAMQAIVRVGCIHATVFAGFSYGALRSRINDCQAKLVITMDSSFRGGREIQLRDTVVAALKGCPSVKNVLTMRRTGNRSDQVFAVPEHSFDEVKREVKTCDPVPMDSEAPLYIMYTSGSTGKPKGLVHTNAGFCVNMKMSMRHAWDIWPDDILGCPADVGWQVGHSMNVYGSLLNGNQALLFESTPVYPNPARFYHLIQKYKITQFMSAPTAYRMLMRDDDCIDNYDLSSLRCVATCGEITDFSTWTWLHDRFGGGKTAILDSWWQTETGCPMLNPWPSAVDAPIPKGKSARPFYGVDPCLLGDDKIEHKTHGHLCIRQAWPGMARSIHGDHERYVNTYFKQYPGYYASGDGADKDQDGFFQISGRTDDVINIAGHRLSTSEIENIVAKHDAVAEVAVIGANDSLKDNHTNDNMETDLTKAIVASIGKWARPSAIIVCDVFPKTRSGKIMRRLLRAIGNGTRDFGDESVIADRDSLDHVIERFENNQ